MRSSFTNRLWKKNCNVHVLFTCMFYQNIFNLHCELELESSIMCPYKAKQYVKSRFLCNKYQCMYYSNFILTSCHVIYHFVIKMFMYHSKSHHALCIISSSYFCLIYALSFSLLYIYKKLIWWWLSYRMLNYNRNIHSISIPFWHKWKRNDNFMMVNHRKSCLPPTESINP